MKATELSSSVNIKNCSQCSGDTEYYCHICQKDLCLQCKEEHVINLDTLPHNVTIYRGKLKYRSKQEACEKHPNMSYNQFCETCAVPVCDSCSEHKPRRFPRLALFFPSKHGEHKLVSIKRAYQNKWKQHQTLLHHIRSETIYNRSILLKGFMADIGNESKICHNNIDLCHAEMVEKSLRLKGLIDEVLGLRIEKEKFKEKCLNQKIKMIEFITRIQNYVDRYEQRLNRPVTFLQFIKKEHYPKIQNTARLTKHNFLLPARTINMEGLIQFLSEIKIKQRGKRQARNERLLKLMPSPVLLRAFTLSNILSCYHISCVNHYEIWVSGYIKHYKTKFILSDTISGNALHHVTDPNETAIGFHTVNMNGDLIYIDKNNNINILSCNLETKTTFKKRIDNKWEALCLFCSRNTGDLLVGMYNLVTKTGKVTRFDTTGQLTQTIYVDDTDNKLFTHPDFITENSNGDVVVNDARTAVVVTDRAGRHRFSYKGHPSLFSRLRPAGICTDPLSHILVCSNDNVHILDKDGHFLSLLLPKQADSYSLSYDFNNHVLCVGSQSKSVVFIYSYITRHDVLTGQNNEQEIDQIEHN